MSGAGSVFFAAYESQAEAAAVQQLVEAALQQLINNRSEDAGLISSLQLRCLVVAAG